MQTTLLNTVTLSEFTDLVEKDYITYQKMVEPMAQKVFVFANMAAHTGDSKRFDEVDTETFAKLKRQGMNASKASVGVGYNKTMNVKRLAREIDITWEHRRYNKSPEVTGLLTSLKHFIPQRRELDLTHRLTFSSASTYTDMDGESVDITGGDALPAVYSAHTLKFSALTWRNRIANDPVFSGGGLDAGEALFTTDILSNFGERRVINPNTIISGDDPSTVKTIRKEISSTSDVNQNNPGVINVNKAAYAHLILPYLASTALGANDSTKKRWWFLGALGLGVNGLQAYYGEWEAANLKTPPAEGNNGENVNNDNWTYGTRGSYGIAIVSARGLVGSLPTS